MAVLITGPHERGRMTRLLQIIAAVATLFVAPIAAAHANEVIASGEWVKKTQAIRGTWSIVERDGRTFIEFDDQFRTRNAPDLKVFLTADSSATLENENAIDNAVFIARLQSNRGAQSYELPADVNAADFSSVIIHCEQYTKLWGVGDF